MLFNALLGFTFLFFCAFVLITDPEATGKINPNAEVLISVSWAANHPDDVDAVVEDPRGNLVWYHNKDTGLMHLDLVEGSCERWAIRLRPGHLAGTPVARADGITLYAPAAQLNLLQGLSLDYRGDLSGGGFLIRGGEGVTCCACGAAFSRRIEGRLTTQ